MKNIPVVFIHEGKQNYLKKTIQMAEKYNSNVYLIGDQNNRNFCLNWVDNRNFDLKDFKSFSLNYKHMSTNPYQFELNCFKRFYLLYDFMQEKDFKDCMMLDSDLCTYVDYSEMEFKEYDMALSMAEEQEPYVWSASPHCSYWTLEALESFISFFERTYNSNIKILEEKWVWHKENGVAGGICDMTLLYLWISQYSCKWLNLARIYKDRVFDHAVGINGNYVRDTFVQDTNFHVKKTIFISGKPYFKMKDGGRVCVAAIHASGDNKRYINCFAKCSNCFFDYYKADFVFKWKLKIKGLLKRNRHT